MNKKTLTLTVEQYHDIIDTMKTGFSGCRPNKDMAMALIVEANIGLRISDILKLKLSDIVKDGDRYRLNIREQKTKKERFFTVLTEAYQHLKIYCLENNIKLDEQIFKFKERGVQNKLQKVCDYLGFPNAKTSSCTVMSAQVRPISPSQRGLPPATRATRPVFGVPPRLSTLSPKPNVKVVCHIL